MSLIVGNSLSRGKEIPYLGVIVAVMELIALKET